MPRSSFVRSRPVVVGLAGLGLVGALTGCAATGTSSSSGSGASGGSTGSDSTASSVTGPYKDGTYSADGGYQAPSGSETITVTLTLADDKVTKVEIGKHATDPNAVQYQTMFANGISAQVVGKDLDDLAGVSRVAGSSLTSGGFEAAVAAIKKQAKDS